MSGAPPPDLSRRPDWIHPAFRLIESGRVLDWPALAALPVPAGGAVESDRPSTVIAALAAAQRADRPVLLKRHRGPVSPPMPDGGFHVLLETSGTTGTPKLVRHEFARLRGRLRGIADGGARWLLTYEPGAFAGLQVILTAAAAGAVLVAEPGAGVAELARSARTHDVTHASGTPSFWRTFLMTRDGGPPPLASITLGGEIADQPLLDRLAQAFPGARLRHVYASTEAGALFAVADGLAGFPASWLEDGIDGVALRIADGVLEVRSPRAMLDGGAGWLSTGDLVEVRGDRVLFAGRLDGRVNVGGVKVSPEAAEAVLLSVAGVEDALVTAVPNPITGQILTATVVPRPEAEESALRAAIRAALEPLAPAARPRAIRFADHIPLAATGKKTRRVPL